MIKTAEKNPHRTTEKYSARDVPSSTKDFRRMEANCTSSFLSVSGERKINTLWDKATYTGGPVAAEGAAGLRGDSQSSHRTYPVESLCLQKSL